MTGDGVVGRSPEVGGNTVPTVGAGDGGTFGAGARVSSTADGALVGEGMGSPRVVGSFESTVGEGDGLGSDEKGALNGPIVDFATVGEGVGGTSGSLGLIVSTVGAGDVGASSGETGPGVSPLATGVLVGDSEPTVGAGAVVVASGESGEGAVKGAGVGESVMTGRSSSYSGRVSSSVKSNESGASVWVGTVGVGALGVGAVGVGTSRVVGMSGVVGGMPKGVGMSGWGLGVDGVRGEGEPGVSGEVGMWGFVGMTGEVGMSGWGLGVDGVRGAGVAGFSAVIGMSGWGLGVDGVRGEGAVGVMSGWGLGVDGARGAGVGLACSGVGVRREAGA